MSLSYNNVNGIYIPDNGVYKNVTAIIAPNGGSNIDFFPSQYVNTLDPDPTVTSDDCILIRKFRNVSGGYCVIINNSGNSVEFVFKLQVRDAWSGTIVVQDGDTAAISLGNSYGIFIKGAGDSTHTNYGLCKKASSTISSAVGVSICLTDNSNFPQQGDALESIVSGKLASLLPYNIQDINQTSGPFPQMFRFGVIDATFLDLNDLPSNLGYMCARIFFSSSLKFSPIINVQTLSQTMFYQAFAYSTNLKIVRCYSTDISAYGCTKEWLIGTNVTGTFVKARGVTWDTNENGSMESNGWTQKYLDETDIYNNL